MKKFLQGLAVLGCCIVGYFWVEGIQAYSKTKPVPYTVVAHTFNNGATALVLDKGKSNEVYNVTLKEYVETPNGGLYYLDVRIEKSVWWKTILFEVIPILIVGTMVLLLFIGFLAILS